MSRVYLKERDIELFKFLGKYKIILLDNSGKIYNTKTYQEKRMVTLVRHKYINRLKGRYVTLGYKGIEYLSKQGIDIKEHCRNENNIERLKLISDIACMTIGTEFEFIPSWEIKEEDSPTKRARRYLGALNCRFGHKFLVYSSIGKVLKKQHKAICTDIKREWRYKAFIVFSSNYDIINKDTSFIFGENEYVLVISYNEKNKYILMNYYKVDQYEIIKSHLCKGELYLSDWLVADYVSESKEYFLSFLLLDPSKVERLKQFYEVHPDVNRSITIICTEDNKPFLEKQFPKTKIIPVDDKIEQHVITRNIYYA